MSNLLYYASIDFQKLTGVQIYIDIICRLYYTAGINISEYASSINLDLDYLEAAINDSKPKTLKVFGNTDAPLTSARKIVLENIFLWENEVIIGSKRTQVISQEDEVALRIGARLSVHDYLRVRNLRLLQGNLLAPTSNFAIPGSTLGIPNYDIIISGEFWLEITKILKIYSKYSFYFPLLFADCQIVMFDRITLQGH